MKSWNPRKAQNRANRLWRVNLKTLDLLLISVDSPIMLGIYENGKLVESVLRDGKISEILPLLFSEILDSRDSRDSCDSSDSCDSKDSCDSCDSRIRRIFYANGPGNFSAIKLTHIFLQTLKITRGVELFCADSFHFNKHDTIHAYGKIHFLKQNGTILATTLQAKRENAFILPQRLDFNIFSQNCAPLYILPAVSC